MIIINSIINVIYKMSQVNFNRSDLKHKVKISNGLK